MKNKARVHRLATEGEAQVWEHTELGLHHSSLRKSPKGAAWGIPQHLYTTTDEKPKVGDWAYSIVDEEVYFVKEYNDKTGIARHTDDSSFILDGCRKIIATTDPKLFRDGDAGIIDYAFKEGMFEIPQSFIEEYCNAGGIDDVLVEVEILGYKTENIHIGVRGTDIDVELPNTAIDRTQVRPKLDSNNCIIIHPVEEKMVDQKALDICQRIVSYMDASPELKETTMIEIYNKARKWIEENL